MSSNVIFHCAFKFLRHFNHKPHTDLKLKHEREKENNDNDNDDIGNTATNYENRGVTQSECVCMCELK